MHLLSAQIPQVWLIVFWLGALGVGLLIARRAVWRMLRDTANLNVFLGACTVILGFWLIKTGVKPGLDFHLLGATALTLMFRPYFALLALAVVCAALSLWHGEPAAFASAWLLMGALPVAVSWGIYRLVDARLPNHLFIYIFLNAFFGAALALLSVGVASTALNTAIGTYPLDYLLENYLPFYLLVAWGEAFSTGMAITLMVVWKPEWVSTFDDRRYLNR